MIGWRLPATVKKGAASPPIRPNHRKPPASPKSVNSSTTRAKSSKNSSGRDCDEWDGKGLAMQLQLHRLAVRHRIRTSLHDACLVPSSPAVEHPMILEGFASTCTLDLQRMRFRNVRVLAFRFRRTVNSVPLLLKHNADVVAGSKSSRWNTTTVALRIRCRVTMKRRVDATHSRSPRPFWTTKSSRHRRPRRFYAVINSAQLDEISVTDCPPIRMLWCCSAIRRVRASHSSVMRCRPCSSSSNQSTVLPKLQQGVRHEHDFTSTMGPCAIRTPDDRTPAPSRPLSHARRRGGA